MAQTRRSSFCGSPAHALNRRGFFGSMAAGAAAFAADMTSLDVLTTPGVTVVCAVVVGAIGWGVFRAYRMQHSGSQLGSKAA